MMRRRTMRFLAGLLVVGMLLFGGASVALAYGHTGLLRGPAHGPYGATPMMSGQGTMRGGVMGGGMMTGSGMMGGSVNAGSSGQSLTLAQAQQAVEIYLSRLGRPDLAVDEVMEFQQNFYILVKERSTGVGAFELLVDKSTGRVFPEYGPNMMWNAKYTMMGQGQASAPMTITTTRASELAAAWLAQHQPGATTEPPDAFYGYYTVHILKDGTVTGMLSVNGYTGQVWDHSWHGAFIQLLETQP